MKTLACVVGARPNFVKMAPGNWTLFDTLVGDVLEGRYKQGSCPRLWDGQAGRRVAREVAAFLEGLG